jgi:hypothetical protein
MKTLVLFRLPDNTFASCDLSKLAAFPAPGHTYLFNKQQYEVVDAVEPLTTSGGHSQIMDLIALEFNDPTEAARALATIIDLDRPSTGSIGGLGSKIELATEPDKVVLVRLKKPNKGTVKGKQRVSDFTIDVKGLLAGTAPVIDTDAPASGGRSRRRRSQS